MKKLLIIAICITISVMAKAQCWLDKQPRESGYQGITAALTIDKSMRFYEPSGFSGTNIQAGIWIDWIGIPAGGVESKITSKSLATREAVVTILGRYWVFGDKIQVNPFFSVGTNNFQDIGVRAGYRIGDGIYLGAVASRSMKYGITVAVSVNRSSR